MDDYTRIDEGRITIIRINRQVSVDRLIEIIRTLVVEGLGDGRVWNGGKYIDFSTSEIDRVVALAKTMPPPPLASAYVAEGIARYGVLRMYEALREQEGFRTRVFQDEAEAIAWVRSMADSEHSPDA